MSGKFSFTLQAGCVRVDEARDRLQTKTKLYNMTFSSVIYIMALTALFWNKEKDSARLQAWKKIKKNFLGQR